jgi:YVTN family beta-propeller protein
MNFRITGLLAIAAFVVACLLDSAQSLAQNAYITNAGSNNVSVIDTATNMVTAAIPAGVAPWGLAVTPDGSKVYVANSSLPGFVTVIDTATNAVTATIPNGSVNYAVAVSQDGSKVYVTNTGSNSVSVIDTATNTVKATIPAGSYPWGVAVTPDGSRVYVANETVAGTVSVMPRRRTR